ncbi:Succinate dehydrogenase hydrophobic membrane anchor protein [hydrothermal vent metagenome]|uniref:Succinate dehydrogenase hydrophobic membrane anchor protein n=1 Tax=hydrothermal vent metagenome TaxID=652676 RepID=A0A3B0X6T2_9ZZZZ
MSSPGLQGLRPWIIQRVSAVLILGFVFYIAIVLLTNSPLNVNDWAAWVAKPYNNLLIGLTLIAVLWHAWIGIRDIILDYVPNVVGRLLVLTLVGGTLIGSGLWGFKALFMVFIK